MCCSRLGQIAYGALALISVALICAAMFTPGWRQFRSQVVNSIQQNQIPVLNMGLFQYACSLPGTQAPNGNYNNGNEQMPIINGEQQAQLQNSRYNIQGQMNNQFGGQQQQFPNNQLNNGGGASPTNGNPLDYCFQWWQNQPAYEKVVIASLIIGLLASILSFVWNLATFCVCCFKGVAQKPLPAISGIAAVSLAIGVGLYWYQNQGSIQQLQSLGQYGNMVMGKIPETSDVSYSFWMACGAAVASFANIIVGTLIVCLADSCL